MRAPLPGEEEAGRGEAGEPEAEAKDVTRDERAFTILVRNEVFAFVRALAKRDYTAAKELLEERAESPWNERTLEQALAPFYAERSRILTDPKSRAPSSTRVTKKERSWELEQVLHDDQEHDDWALRFIVDLDRSREEGRAVLSLAEVVSPP